jgi:lysine-specific permease
LIIGVVYQWLISISGVAGLIAWLNIAVCHFQFRRAYVLQGFKVEDLPFKARWYPFGPIFAFLVCSFVLVGQGYSTWTQDPIDPIALVACYIGVPIVVVLYVVYKVVKKTKFIPLAEVDLVSGRQEILM